MDVNVRDVEEIVRFGNSLKGFLSGYIEALGRITTGANCDYTTARNALNSIRTKMESAESALDSAEFALSNVERQARNNPDEDYSNEIYFREEQVEEKQELYDRAKEAFDEADVLVKRIKVQTDMAIEQVWKSRNQIQDGGRDALQAIQNAARIISQYIRR